MIFIKYSFRCGGLNDIFVKHCYFFSHDLSFRASYDGTGDDGACSES